MTLGRLLAASCTFGALAGLLWTADADATRKVYSPQVEYRELEVEARGGYDVDNSAARDGAQVYKYALGYGVTPRWFTEVYGEMEKAPGEEAAFESIEIENRFQVFDIGERWLDLGLYFGYEMSLQQGHADEFEGKVLLQKQYFRIVHMANVILKKEIGVYAQEGTEAGFAWNTRYRLMQAFEPGVEYYGDFGPLAGMPSFDRQVHLAGLAARGKVGNLKYDVGYLFGLSDAAPDGTIKGIVEYEMRF